MHLVYQCVYEALERLQELDSRQARMVEMHYFAGNPVEEIASALGISDRTVKRELQFARLFLKQQLEGKGMKLRYEPRSKCSVRKGDLYR
jgi:DNA-directed RNA polymerase specialized sigma24 family protein